MDESTVGRRASDPQLAELTERLKGLVDDLHELKRDQRDRDRQRDHEIREERLRINDLVAWKLEIQATWAERERNQQLQETGMVSKRQFWLGVATVIVGVSGAMATILAALAPHA